MGPNWFGELEAVFFVCWRFWRVAFPGNVAFESELISNLLAD